MDDLHSRTVAELHGLLRERECAGDESLRRDDRGDRRERDQRILERAGRQQEERIDRARRFPQDQRALPEVARQQPRQHQEEPGEADRPLAEVSHVGVERLRSRDGQDNGAEENESGVSMPSEEFQTVQRIRRSENLRAQQNLGQSESPDRHEPNDHHGPEYPPDLGGAVLLEEEKPSEYRDGEGEYQVLRLRSHHFQTCHGAQHRDRRRDHAIAVEQRRSDQSQRDDSLAAQGVRVAPLLLKNERQQRENSALAIVVRPHDEDDVLDADDDYQRPDDQRQNAVDVFRRRSEAMLRFEALAQGIEGTGADVPINDA